MKAMTREEFRVWLEAQIEPPIPESIIEWAAARHDKPLNRRYIPEGWQVRKIGTLMTYLDEIDESERSLLIAHQTKNVTVPTPEELMAQNVCYFAAREERNAKRRAILDRTIMFDHAFRKYVELENAKAALLAAFRQTTETYSPLENFPDLYAMLAEIGIDREYRAGNESRLVVQM